MSNSKGLGANYKVTSAYISKQGNRNYNEDSVVTIGTENYCLYGVADGLGGQGFGKIASESVLATVRQVFEENADNPDFLSLAFEKAQEKIMEKKSGDEYGDMMTTLALLSISGDIRWAHIGDTRIYLFKSGHIAAQTLDHSVPQVLVYADEISFDEIRHHPDRNRLLRAMGKEWEKSEYEISDSYEIESNEAILLCSDGFWEHILEDEMEAMLALATSPEDWLDKMESIIIERGHNYDMDNYSAIAVWIK